MYVIGLVEGSRHGALNVLGTYVLELDASDGALNSAGRITVSVVPHNDAPVVSAGPNRTLPYPTRTTTLVGTASDDGQPAGSALAVKWSTVSGPGAVTFTTPNSATAAVSFGYLGTYVPAQRFGLYDDAD